MILCCLSCLQCCSSFYQNCPSYFRVLRLLSIHRLKQLFCHIFVKSFYRRYMNLVEFFCCLRMLILCFASSHITFKIKPIILLKYLWVFKHVVLFICCFQHKCNLTCFHGVRALVILYLCTTSTPVNMYLYVLPSNILQGT